MAIQLGIERYTPKKEIDLVGRPVGHSFLEVGGKIVPHLETLDFPKEDPWSLSMRGVIAQVRNEGGFRGQHALELGIGDGRNAQELGPDVKSVVGVDIESWRLEVAGYNLVTGPARIKSPVELWRGDAVEFLRDLKVIGRDKLEGRVIMCLPQSPDGANATDKYNGSVALNDFRTAYDKYGLTLNAAVLDVLRPIVDKDLVLYAIVSDRVIPQAKQDMFRRTGWQVLREFRTDDPVQQDPRTGVHWVRYVDDGRRFFEKNPDNRFTPISAIEMENRRVESMASGSFREGLNGYHYLTVHELGVR